MKRLRITVEGKVYDVTVEVLEENAPATIVPLTPVSAPAVSAPSTAVSSMEKTPATGDVVSPMAGNVVRLVVQSGDSVKPGDLLLWLEAMKMETPIYASSAGKVSYIAVKQGDTVHEGQLLIKIS